jgi:hypothetical protein
MQLLGEFSSLYIPLKVILGARKETISFGNAQATIFYSITGLINQQPRVSSNVVCLVTRMALKRMTGRNQSETEPAAPALLRWQWTKTDSPCRRNGARSHDCTEPELGRSLALAFGVEQVEHKRDGFHQAFMLGNVCRSYSTLFPTGGKPRCSASYPGCRSRILVNCLVLW